MTDESQIQFDQFLKDEITELFQSLEKEVERYFPELSQEQEALSRNPFFTELDVPSIPDDIQDAFLDLRNYSAACDIFRDSVLVHHVSAIHISQHDSFTCSCSRSWTLGFHRVLCWVREFIACTPNLLVISFSGMDCVTIPMQMTRSCI